MRKADKHKDLKLFRYKRHDGQKVILCVKKHVNNKTKHLTYLKKLENYLTTVYKDRNFKLERTTGINLNVPYLNSGDSDIIFSTQDFISSSSEHYISIKSSPITDKHFLDIVDYMEYLILCDNNNEFFKEYEKTKNNINNTN